MAIPFASTLSGTAAAAALSLAILATSTAGAAARNETPPAYVPVQDAGDEGEAQRLPLPDPQAPPDITGPPREGNVTRHNPDTGTPEVIYDLEQLPEPVRRMRRLIIEACKSGDIERLRPLIGSGETATRLTLGALEEDPIDFLREVSGDEDGQEILAILLEIMEAGFVRLDAGEQRELYVWPYFFTVPLEELTPEQRVELFTIVTAGDYEDMKTFGAYIFYRAAITPEGRWLYFVAGD